MLRRRSRRRARPGPRLKAVTGRQARGVAQLGSALALGARGRGFKSRHPDSINKEMPRRLTVKSTVETLSATRVRLAIEVPFDELKPSLQKAYREIGSQVQIPGFFWGMGRPR